MRKLWLPCILGLLAVALFLVLMARFRPWGPRSGPLAGSVGSSAPEALEGAGLPEGEPATPALTEGAAASSPEFLVEGASLHGTVYDDAGRPLPGATVFVVPLDDLASADFELTRILRERLVGRGRALPQGVAASATTDARGEYAIPIDVLYPATYQAVARHPEYVPQSETWTWAPESAEIDFRLGPGEAISGRVLGPDRKPVAGAEVQAFLDEERRGPPPFAPNVVADRDATDSEGRFRLGVAGGRYRIVAAASGYSRAEVEGVHAGTRDLDVVLALGRNLVVKVLDEIAEPIAGAEVALLEGGFGFGRGGPFGGGFFGPGGGFRGGRGEDRFGAVTRIRRRVEAPDRLGRTGADGTVRFDELSSGEYLVSVEKAGWVPKWETVELGDEAETHEVQVSLEEGRAIAGLVKDPDGRPVPKAYVLVGEDRTEEDAQRRERLQRVEELRQRMGEIDPSLDPEERRRRFEGLAEEMRRLGGGPEGLGRGGGPGGFGPGGGGVFSVALPAPDRPEPVPLVRAAAACETDRGGRFRFDTLAPGRYSLSVQSDRFVVYRKDGIELGDAPVSLEVVLDPGLRLEGRVLSKDGGGPVPGAKIRAGTGFGFLAGDERFATSDEEGAYSLSGLLPGPLGEVLVRAKGYGLLVERGIELKGGAVVERDFVLEPAATIAGVVTDAHGNPILNAQVVAAPAVEPGGGPPFFRMFGAGRSNVARDRTDGEGRFFLAEVDPAPAVRIEASHPDFRRYQSEPFSLKPGERVADLRLPLRSGGRIEVWVRGPDGSPVASARVTIELEGNPGDAAAGGGGRGPGGEGQGRGGRRGQGGFGRGFFSRSSGPDGKAVFAALDAGSYRLSTAARGFQPHFARVDASDETVSTVAADLLPENAIAGAVKDRMGLPVAGAAIEVFREAEGGWPRERSFARSEDDGSFRAGGLGDADYAVRVRCEGFAERTFERVAANSRLDVVLDRLGGVSGWAVTAETGAPIPRFAAELRQPGAEGRGRPQGGRPDGRLRRTFDDPAGAFLFEDVPPGEYDLQVSASGHSSVLARVTVREGLVTQGLRVELPAGLVLVGFVTTDGGAVPVAGARVFLVPGARAGRGQPGTEEGTAGARGGREQRRAAFEERRAERRGGGGERAETEAAPAGIPGTAIAAAIRGGNPIAVSDETGRFELRDVPEGTYVLVVDHEALLPGTRDVDLREGRFENPVGIVLKRGESLAGTIRLQDGGAAAGAVVFVRDASGLTRRGVADGAGRYAIEGLAVGTHTFFVRGPGELRSARAEIAIRKGSNRADYRYGANAPEVR